MDEQSPTDHAEAVAHPARLFGSARVARLATVDSACRPHLVPIVFAVAENTIYSAVDAKPKTTQALRRLSNVQANAAVAVLADHYDEDWTHLWWVRADGRGRVLRPRVRPDVTEVRLAIGLLVSRYPQYAKQAPPGPVLAVDVERWSSWSAAG